MNMHNAVKMLQTGDIIGVSFADTPGTFGRAARVFEKITGGPISHVGIIEVKKGFLSPRKVSVIEAGDFMMKTSIRKFVEIAGGKVAVFRYKHMLTEEQKEKMIHTAYKWLGKTKHFWKKIIKYDHKLAAGTEELYCSELVDEAYKSVGIRLTNDYISIKDAKDMVYELFSRNPNAFGPETKSAAEAFGFIWGPNGFYFDPNIDLDKNPAKNIISPYKIMVNDNTVKVFSNIDGV